MVKRVVFSIKTLLIAILLPFCFIISFLLIYLGYELKQIDTSTQNFYAEFGPTINKNQAAYSYLNTLNNNVYLICFASQKEARVAYDSSMYLLSSEVLQGVSARFARRVNFLRSQIDNFYDKRLNLTAQYNKAGILWSNLIDEVIAIHKMRHNDVFVLVGAKDFVLVRQFGYSAKDIYDKVAFLKAHINNICKEDSQDGFKGKCKRLKRDMVIFEEFLVTLNDDFGDFEELYRTVMDRAVSVFFEYSDEERNILSEQIDFIKLQVNKSGYLFIFIAIFSVLLILSIVFFIIFVFVKPINSLTKLITNFNQKGHFDRRDATFVKDIENIVDLVTPLLSKLNRTSEKSVQLTEQVNELSSRYLVDDLTKILNRRALNEYLDARGDELVKNVAFIMCDIDFFKLLNDTSGHLNGDLVLYRVAQSLHGNISKNDRVYRYGGEEFCIVLFNVTNEEALGIAQRLCQKVEEMGIIHTAFENRSVTISAGISLVNDDENGYRYSCDELIDQADKALYISKQTGRNRVTSYDRNVSNNLVDELGSIKPLKDAN